MLDVGGGREVAFNEIMFMGDGITVVIYLLGGRWVDVSL